MHIYIYIYTTYLFKIYSQFLFIFILVFIYNYIYIYIYLKLFINIHQYQYYILTFRDTNIDFLLIFFHIERLANLLKSQVKDLEDDSIQTAFKRIAANHNINNNKKNNNNNNDSNNHPVVLKYRAGIGQSLTNRLMTREGLGRQPF